MPILNFTIIHIIRIIYGKPLIYEYIWNTLDLYNSQ